MLKVLLKTKIGHKMYFDKIKNICISIFIKTITKISNVQKIFYLTLKIVNK